MTNVRRTLTYARSSRPWPPAVSPRAPGRAAGPSPRSDAVPAPRRRLLGGDVAGTDAAGRRRRLIVGIGLYEMFFDTCPASPACASRPASGWWPAALTGGARRLRAGAARAAGRATARWRWRWPAWSPRRGLRRAHADQPDVVVERPLPAPWPTVHRVNDGPLAYRYLVGMRRDTCSSSCHSAIRAGTCATSTTPGLHGKRIVNGYSGYFPDGYRARAARLAGLWSDRDAAWRAVTSSGATHVLVHRDALPAARRPGRHRLGAAGRGDAGGVVCRRRRVARVAAALIARSRPATGRILSVVRPHPADGEVRHARC